MKVKIYGAGSIGNHLAQAARRMEWDVLVVDKDPEALKRMKEDIYPTRYGAWDDAIEFATLGEEPGGGFDIIFIGTPPDVHLEQAIASLDEKPKVLQIEKPLCPPSADEMEVFAKKAEDTPETKVIVGYDHTVSEAFNEMVSILKKKSIGDIKTIDVEFREHWQGIFNAHPWLDGPHDTYLGFWKRGGGASGEHSHALHMWLALSEVAELGTVTSGSAYMNMTENDTVSYDALSAFTLHTDKNITGRVIQDIVTQPARKWARIQGENGFVEWLCGGHPDGDLIRVQIDGAEVEEQVFAKTRPDDFLQEMKHIEGVIDNSIDYTTSPLRLAVALQVMRILNASHEHRNDSFSL